MSLPSMDSTGTVFSFDAEGGVHEWVAQGGSEEAFKRAIDAAMGATGVV